MKRAAAASTLAASTGLAGCAASGSQDQEGGKRTSMATIANLSNSYWLSWVKGYREAAEALGYAKNVQTNGGVVSTQIQQFDTAIASNTDAIVGQTYTNAAAIILSEACVEAGIPTILAGTIANWYTPQDAGEEYVQFFAPHFVEHAYTAAKVLFEEMGGEGGFVHIEGNRGTAPNAGRNIGVEKAMKEYPDIELLGPRLQGNWVRTDSRDGMSDLVSKHGSEIDGYFGQNDAVAIGGLTILEENGIDVPVVGIDAGEPALRLIEQGRMACSVSGMGPWQGGWSMAKVHDYIQGHRMQPAERMMYFFAPLVVKNPQEWRNRIGSDIRLPIIQTKEYEQATFQGPTPYDWKKMSVAESGADAWDPQIQMGPIRRKNLSGLLAWQKKDKPDWYSLPDVFGNEQAMQDVERLYENHHQMNPIQQ